MHGSASPALSLHPWLRCWTKATQSPIFWLLLRSSSTVDLCPSLSARSQFQSARLRHSSPALIVLLRWPGSRSPCFSHSSGLLLRLQRGFVWSPTSFLWVIWDFFALSPLPGCPSGSYCSPSLPSPASLPATVISISRDQCLFWFSCISGDRCSFRT